MTDNPRWFILSPLRYESITLRDAERIVKRRKKASRSARKMEIYATSFLGRFRNLANGILLSLSNFCNFADGLRGGVDGFRNFAKVIRTLRKAVVKWRKGAAMHCGGFENMNIFTIQAKTLSMQNRERIYLG